MTAPSRKDVDAMANILKAMNGDTSGVKEERQEQLDTQGGVDLTPGISSEDVKAMENIMLKFANASNNVSEKVAHTINESKKIDRGVSVGEFQITKNDAELYDIHYSTTDNTLFEDIRLYETAYLIVKYLNEGKKINSKEITQIISTNALFENYYYDAMNHKRTFKNAKQRKDYKKMNIAEARFDQAKNDATVVKRKIKSLYESKR